MSEIKTVAIIGAGSVATNLARVLNPHLEICNIWSRNPENAKELSQKLNLGDDIVVDDLVDLDTDLDLYLISVPDNAYDSIYKQLPALRGIIANTSGASPIPFSKEKRERCGVFYPLQSFRKEKTADFSKIPMLIEGNDNETILKLQRLAEKISEKVIAINDNTTKAKIHLAGVFASNFPNYLWGIADSIMKECGGDLGFLENLIKETLENALAMGPTASQTGPAMRGDTKILKRHMELIGESSLPLPETEELYSMLSNAIIKKFNPDNEQNRL